MMNLQELLYAIDSNQEKISSYGKFDEATLKKINYKFRLDWNYYSNRMEGGTLTRKETRSVMVGNIDIKNKPLKDVMEMTGHDKMVLELLSIGKGEKRISERRIKEIHKAIIYEENDDQKKQIGVWKTEPNEIINYKNEKIAFASPADVSDLMHKLLDTTNSNLDAFFNDKKNKKHPLFIASDFHLDYITIHPFFDGNGRTARIFTNLILISCGLPVIIIKDEHKAIYYQYLADIQVYGGNEDLFYHFIGERILESQQLILSALEGENIEEDDDIDKRIALLKRQLQTDDTVKEKKSPKTIHKVIKETAFPLFEAIENKCKAFNEFFMDHGKSVEYLSRNTNHINAIGSKGFEWAALTRSWLEESYWNEKIDLKTLSFHYVLSGFKKNKAAQSVSTSIEFQFEEYNYRIVCPADSYDQQLVKTYNDPLTPEEKSAIVTKLVGRLIDDVERYSKKD